WVDKPLEEVFSFFSDAKNLEDITPGWLNFHITGESPGPMGAGKEIDYKLQIKGVPAKWKTRIAAWDPPHKFVDIQEKGPYKSWHHSHHFQRLGNGVLLTDKVHYELPLMPLGSAILPVIRADVEKIFSYRKKELAARLRTEG